MEMYREESDGLYAQLRILMGIFWWSKIGLLAEPYQIQGAPRQNC